MSESAEFKSDRSNRDKDYAIEEAKSLADQLQKLG
jgi:hypothetical protein